MKKISIEYINRWFDEHPGGVFRCYQEFMEQNSILEKPKCAFNPVFVMRIKDYFYVANERDIYNNGLGTFYSSIGMGDNIPEKTDNYIRIYSREDSICTVVFISFYRNEEDLNAKQDMPWFSEDIFNRTKFISDIYKCIHKMNNVI